MYFKCNEISDEISVIYIYMYIYLQPLNVNVFHSVPSKECYEQKKVHPNCTSVVDIHNKEVEDNSVLLFSYHYIVIFVRNLFEH